MEQGRRAERQPAASARELASGEAVQLRIQGSEESVGRGVIAALGGRDAEEIDGWAVHAGGRSILDAVETAGIATVPPLVVGLALLTQPAISGFVGWVVYDEKLRPVDWLGAAAIAAALVLVRLPQRGLRAAAVQPS